MNRIAKLIILAIGLGGFSGCGGGDQVSSSQPVHDLIIHNAKILTVDDSFSIAEAVAIKDGEFVAVGTDSEMLAMADPKTRVVDLKGRTVLPGFNDTHSHVVKMGLNLPASIDLPWCTTPIEAESSLGPDSHHPIISLSGIPSAVMVLRILHPILASPLCAANPLARIAEPTIAL